MFKRITSLLLAVAMLLTLVPAPVLAAETETIGIAETVPETTVAEESSVPTEPAQETSMPTEPITEPTAEASVPVEEISEPSMDPTLPAEEFVSQEPAMANVAGGSCGENLTWTLDDTGTLTISGIGTFENCSCESGYHNNYCSAVMPWRQMTAQIRSVVVEDGVTGICTWAFRDCVNLTKVSMPESVCFIGYTMDSGGGAGTTDDGAFLDCPELTSAGPIGSGCDYEFGWTETIPDGAFAYMTGLEKVIMPETVKVIESGAFCGSDEGIVTAGPIGSGCNYEFGWKTEIIRGAFSGLSSLETVMIPEGITAIADYAFQMCSSLTELTLPNTLTSIGRYAFNGCKGLKTLTLPDTLEQIGENAFAVSGLESIVLPPKVTAIPTDAFAHCDDLKLLTIPETVTQIGTCAFYHCSALEHVEIQGPVTEIPSHCFTLCENLKTVILPKTVTSIGNYAFSSCDNLMDIIFLGTYSQWQKITKGTNNEVLEYKPLFCQETDSGTCGEGTTWSLSREGKLTLSGQGPVTERPWHDLLNLIPLTQIIIEEGVTEVGVGFYHFKNQVEKITVAESVLFTVSNPFFHMEGIETAGPIGSGADYEYGWTTAIPAYAFNQISTLKQIEWPEGLLSIGNQAFFGCSALEEVDLPDTLTSIGSQAFAYCHSLKRLVIPGGVSQIFNVVGGCSALTDFVILGPITDLQGLPFHGCTSLKTLTLPRSLRYIYSNALYGCDGLTDIYFTGTQEEWDAIYKNPTGNERLFDGSVTIHYGYNAVYLKDVYYYSSSIGGIYLVGPEGGTECKTSTELSDSDFLADKDALLGYFVIPEFVETDSGTILKNLLPVESHSGTVTAANYQQIAIGGKNFVTPIDLKDPWQYAGKYVIYHIYDGNLAGLTPLSVEEFLDNTAIPLNGSGKAWAYYQTTPNLILSYRVDEGPEQKIDSGSNGILKIPLGEFQAPVLNTVFVDFTKVGNVALEPAIRLTPSVDVKPFTYTQKTSFSISPYVSFEYGAGAGINLADWEAKIAAASMNVAGGVKIGVDLTRSYGPDGESLELLISGGPDITEKISSGIFIEKEGKKDKKYNLSILSAEAGVKTTEQNSIGIRLDEFKGEREQNLALALPLMIGIVCIFPSNPLLGTALAAAGELSKEIYSKVDFSSVFGLGVSAGSTTGADLGTVTINDKDLFTLGSFATDGMISMNTKWNSSGTKSKSYQISTEGKSAWGTFKGQGPKAIGTELSAKSQSYLSSDIQFSAERSDDGAEISTSSLSETSENTRFLALGEYYNLDYDKYIFRDTALDKLLDSAPGFYSFLYRENFPLSDRDVLKMADIISGRNDPVEYTQETTQKAVFSVPLKVGAQLIVGAGTGAPITILDEISYSSAGGTAFNDTLWLTSETTGMEQRIKNEIMDVPEYIQAILTDLAVALKEVLVKVGGLIRDGVEALGAKIAGKKDSDKDWTVAISYVGSGAQPAAASYRIDTFSAAKSAAMAGGITAVQQGDALAEGATVSMPYLVSVTDNATGEEVTDFSEEPLELTISYTEETLKAAGLSVHSEMVRNGEIAMYRYSDNGDYFEKLETSAADTEAMTVTATITAPGQYVLAADACAPELRYLDISDFRTNPTITAYVDDLTGLDLEKFEFALDGTLRVDGGSVADHYDTKTGTFTYTVPEGSELAEGKHTMSFTLADTAGNEDTYAYSFYVDLTAPEITEESVLRGKEDSTIVEIRAKVEDEHLTQVNAVFTKELPDGQKMESRIAMGDLGDGLWGVDYQGDGSGICVRIEAVDIGENIARTTDVKLDAHLNSIELDQTYVLLAQNQTRKLQAKVIPEELAAAVTWRPENPETNVIEVHPDGTVRGLNPGTDYVLAEVTSGGRTVTARCQVEVTKAIEIENVHLNTRKVTSELYSTDYTQFEIYLQQKKDPVQTAAVSRNASMASAEGTETGPVIEYAWFEDTKGEMGQMFWLEVVDDRQIRIVPSSYAVNNPKLVKGKYTGCVAVQIQGKTHYTEELTLTVKKTQPKLKVTVPAFNSFYSFQEKPITVTGGTVVTLWEDTSKAAPMPNWLKLEEGMLKLTEDAPAKSLSGKAYLMVQTSEWCNPVPVTVSVKNTYKVPGLKLSATTLTFGLPVAESEGVALKLQPKSKGDTLESLRVTGISTETEGCRVENFDRTDGSFVLKPEEGFKAGKIQLDVHFGNTDRVLSVPVTLKTAAVKLKLDKKSITLNAEGGSDVLKLAVTPADRSLAAPDIRLTDAAGEETKDLDIRYEAGKILVRVRENTKPDTTYKLSVTEGGSTVNATIKTISRTPSVTAKVKGNLDLSFPEQTTVITPAFKNYSGGFELVGPETEGFLVEQEGNTLLVTCADTVAVGSHALPLTLKLDDGKQYPVTVKVTVKRTAVKLKLSAAKVSLNKILGDVASVSVSCSTKNYAFDFDGIHLVYDTESLKVDPVDGKLEISLQADAEYGKTYPITVSAYEGAPAVKLNVAVLKQTVKAKSTIKASGTLDLIRDGTAITIKPTYTNVLNVDLEKAVLKIYSSRDSYQIPVKTLDAEDGVFVIDSSVISDSSFKYKAELETPLYEGEDPIRSNRISLNVKMGSAKLTVRTSDTTLFAKDGNDRALVWFETKDAALNAVADIAVKDAKYQNLFEEISYGNGVFAIGFAGKNADESLVGKTVTVTLNVFMKGNETQKANTTAKVKLTVVK